jgi:hypothetical protein
MKKIFLLSISMLLFAFKIEYTKSEYLLPPAPQSVFCYDIDLDGDLDIITGHSSPMWGGCNILFNDSNGNFSNNDSIYFDPGFPEAKPGFFDNNNFPDIFSLTVSQNPYTIYITIIYNYAQTQFDSIKSFTIYNQGPVPFITSGDVNGDGFSDLLFAHNNDFLWGVIYNDGTGNFSVPEYFGLTFPPMDIACADLNDDGRDDVIIASSYTQIFYSDTAGFIEQTLGYTWTTGCKVLVCDFDNDNMKDILIVGGVECPHTRIYMFKNLENNQFQQMPDFEFDQLTQYALSSDFNNDSLPDIVFSAHDNSGLYIYKNAGDFELEYNQFIPMDNFGVILKRVCCGDLDGNGFNDIVTIRSGGINLPSNLNIKFNDGQGNFVNDPITGNQISNSKFQNPIRCYPNPFSDETRISTGTDENEIENLEIYNLEGKQIKEFLENTSNTGVHEFLWDGKDNNGKEVKSGLYFIHLKSGGKVYTQKVMKIK